MFRATSPAPSFREMAPSPLGQSLALDNSDSDILSFADPGADSRVALFVPGALELACALIRQGASDVKMVRIDDRIHPADTDVVIVPQVASAEYLARAIPCARRMLAPLGTITIRLTSATEVRLAPIARQHLLLLGFDLLRTRSTFEGTLIRAELPLCGRLACA